VKTLSSERGAGKMLLKKGRAKLPAAHGRKKQLRKGGAKDVRGSNDLPGGKGGGKAPI